MANKDTTHSDLLMSITGSAVNNCNEVNNYQPINRKRKTGGGKTLPGGICSSQCRIVQGKTKWGSKCPGEVKACLSSEEKPREAKPLAGGVGGSVELSWL